MTTLLDLDRLAVQAFPAILWGEGAFARSGELSPLYAQRYHGPHGRPVPSHHSFWELIFVFRGQGSLHAGGTWPLAPNTAALVPAGIGHAEQSAEPMDTLWVGLSGSRLTQLDTREVHVASADALAVPCEQLWLWGQRRQQKVGCELDAMASVIVFRLLRLIAEAHPHEEALVDRAMQYIGARLGEAISVRQIASHAGCSQGHLQRTFGARTGRTLLQYLAARRIERAVEMMRQTSLPLGRIARHCGYDDPLYFSRVFRKHTGTSPRTFRRGL